MLNACVPPRPASAALLIHHLNPQTPFYRLPEAMAALPELQHPAITTLRPHDILACFRANLWETTTQRMVSYRHAVQ